MHWAAASATLDIVRRLVMQAATSSGTATIINWK
jgi:hypothetical protein